MFYPGPKPAPEEEEDEMDHHRVETYDLQEFMEEPDLIQSHTGFETYDYSVEVVRVPFYSEQFLQIFELCEY